jgi:outer membrane lipoprotein-sorting protein
MNPRSLVLVPLLGVLSLGARQAREDPGRRIAQEANERASGYGDVSAAVTMILRNGRGGERSRSLTIKTLEAADGGERTLIVFDQPRDLRGTAVLTHSYPDRRNDQWIYLPAMRRVRRIAGSKQSESFMGSEFAYGDIGAMTITRYTYRLLGEEKLDGFDAFKVERRPLDPGSPYHRQIVWIDRDEYRILRIDYYDDDDALLKSLQLRGFQQYADRFWRPDEMEMINHQTGGSTLLLWSDYVYGAGLSERELDPNALRRAR